MFFVAPLGAMDNNFGKRRFYPGKCGKTLYDALDAVTYAVVRNGLMLIRSG